MHHDPRQIEDYESLESIGSGSFGLIRKVRRKADGKILARKEIDYRKMSTKEKEQLVAEVNILKDLKHPNIVEFLERVIDRENSFIYILMEYCEGGDLAAVIRRHKEKSVSIPEEFVWNIMTQLTMALHECHCGMSKGDDANPPTLRAPILHRDLKPDNVFLDGNRNVKLGDFGLSRSLSNPQKAFAQTYVGTPFYMSPELIYESVYDIKSDIWSLGCVVFEMCALEPPFLAETQAELSAKIKLGRIQMLPAQYSQELNLVVRAMLQVNPRKRPTTMDLLSNARIKVCKKQLEIDKKTEELAVRERIVTEWAEKYRNKESDLTTYERKLRAEEQRLREMETVLKSKEETLKNREDALRNKEVDLQDQEKRLSRERQHVEERHRELDQERRISMIRKTQPSRQPNEPMALDTGYLQENAVVRPINLSAMNKSSASSRLSLTNAGSVFDQYSNARGTDSTSVSEPVQATWSGPRRKTGLSAGGRHSLQPSHAHRGTSTTSTNGGSTQHATGALDLGSATSRPAGNSNTTQRHGGLNLFNVASEHSSGITSKSSQGQTHIYFGLNGKESRLSGKLGQLGGSVASSSSTGDSQRLRGKSKSASALVASMSSTSLSGMASALPSSNSPFLVPEPIRPATSASSSIRALSGGASNNNFTSSFNFTPSTTLPSTSSANGADIQMSDIVETPSQHTAAPNNGGSFFRPTQLSNTSSGRGLSFNPQGHPPSFSSSSSATNSYSSRRAHASGVTPSVSHIRFNHAPASAPASSTIASNASSATLSTPTPPNANISNTPSLAASVAASSAAATTQDATTTPAKGLVDERFNRSGTPPRTLRQEEAMEWDEIPSPFLKKSSSRPLPLPGSEPSSFTKNLHAS